MIPDVELDVSKMLPRVEVEKLCLVSRAHCAMINANCGQLALHTLYVMVSNPAPLLRSYENLVQRKRGLPGGTFRSRIRGY